MNSLTRHYVFMISSILAIVLLQLTTMYLNQKLVFQIQRFEFPLRGVENVIVVAGTVLASILAGIILSFSMMQNMDVKENGNVYLKGLLLGLPPMIIELLRLSFLLFGITRPNFLTNSFFVRLNIWEWILFSQLPTFWLGIVIGWVIKNRPLKPQGL